ncbi:MAG: efflux RND transporter periplasmic adaptor subunit [Myxococcales bacterium]|jgi:RND family efflux transporter MFP subunit
MNESRIVALATLPMLVGAVLLIGLRRPDPAVRHSGGHVKQRAASDDGPGGGGDAQDGYLGVIVSGYSADVGVEFGGSVVEVWDSVGARVSEGDRLVKIDPRSAGSDVKVARAQLAQQRSALERARVELAEARDVLTRLSAMKDGVSERALVAARAREQRALAAVEEAEAGIGMQQARLGQQVSRSEKHVIRAPFDGILVARFVDPGDVVVPGQVVVRVITEDHYVRFAVPTDAARQLSEGARVRVRLDGADRELHGRVTDVQPELDSAAQMVFVRARLEMAAGQAAREPMAGSRVRVFPAGEGD